MNASELEGAELDLAVAKLEGLPVHPGRDFMVADTFDTMYAHEFWPARIWKHGGPIIERERLTVCAPHDDAPPDRLWQACTHQGHFMEWGQTPLIAAMRAYVASKGKP